MAFAMSICFAVLITVAIFYKEYKTTDQSPVIFLLSLILITILCSLVGVTPMLFTKSPATLVVIGGAMLILLSGTNTFKILIKMPASAYRALAPAAICVGILVLLALVTIL
jgi:hypothetical protein